MLYDINAEQAGAARGKVLLDRLEKFSNSRNALVTNAAFTTQVSAPFNMADERGPPRGPPDVSGMVSLKAWKAPRLF